MIFINQVLNYHNQNILCHQADIMKSLKGIKKRPKWRFFVQI